MKKFRFSLDRLKRYKEQILEAEKNSLGLLRKELRDLNSELSFLVSLIDMKSDELEYIMIKGIAPADLSSRKRFITVKQQEAHEKRRQIALKEKEIEKQLSVVVEATKEVNTLEKLEERQLEEHRYKELKEQELFIEEFVGSSGYRKEISG
ncbi:MAG: flagellar FliJ family protein [Oscillospiraceae bacterium]|jgi:flagellar export protein FliJ|nr:flagellar FliJ family protein [Oscillospiraceae bacterium]